MAQEASEEIEIRSINLREELAALKEFDPLLARRVRREIRDLGTYLVSKIGVELDKEPLGLVTGVKKETRVRSSLSSARRGGDLFTQRTYITEVYSSGSRGNGRGQRARIKAGVKARVSTGQRANGLRISAPGDEFAKAYNKKRFRHPVFGDRKHWVTQAGRPYFGEVITNHSKHIAQEIEAILDGAIIEMNSGA